MKSKEFGKIPKEFVVKYGLEEDRDGINVHYEPAYVNIDRPFSVTVRKNYVDIENEVVSVILGRSHWLHITVFG